MKFLTRIGTQKRTFEIIVYKCEFCNQTFIKENGAKDFHYCPYCGADFIYEGE